MLHYPKIPGSRNSPLGRCIAFEKYDGTNLHWDWDRDFGWHGFGTRRDEFNLTDKGIELFVQTHAHLEESIEVFRATLATSIQEVFLKNAHYSSFQTMKAFTEFFGPNSFAGLHKVEDQKELRLFDVWAEPSGMIGPRQFLNDFGDLRIARVVYEGKLTGKFAEDVRMGKYGVKEGVVCKGELIDGAIWMAKIKTYGYMDRLKKAFADNWEDYWEYNVLNANCFATGTKVLTKDGWCSVEEIKTGDWILSRDDKKTPAGIADWKQVEAEFRRTGYILHLHIEDQVIRTTPEHPFWVQGEGWKQAGALQAGDRLCTLTGEWALLKEVYDTGEWEVVYNLRVADYHTYFVGGDELGGGVWAHNAYMAGANQLYNAAGVSYADTARDLYSLLQSYAPTVVATIAYSVSVSDSERAYIYVFYKPSTMTQAQAVAFRNDFDSGSYGGSQVVLIAGGGYTDHAEQQLFLQHRGDIRAIGISNRGGPCSQCLKFFQDQKWTNIWW